MKFTNSWNLYVFFKASRNFMFVSLTVRGPIIIFPNNKNDNNTQSMNILFSAKALNFLPN